MCGRGTHTHTTNLLFEELNEKGNLSCALDENGFFDTGE
jgi:hypothetical protein